MNVSLFSLNTCDLGLLPLILGTLIPFLLGLLLGWLIWSKWRKMYDDMVSKYDKLTADFNRVTAEKEEWETKHGEVSILLKKSRNDYTRLDHTVDEYKGTITSLEGDISQFKLDAETAKASIAGLTAGGSGNQHELDELKGKYNAAIADRDKLTKELATASSSLANASNNDNQNELAEIKSKNAKLESELNALRSTMTERDDKMAQLTSQLSTTAAAPIAQAPTSKDDLTKVEGIGPKTKELFYTANLYTFDDLANSNVSDLQQILTDGGSRFQLLDAGTWPRQARLAADGKWDELGKLQDYLDGGKEPTEKALTDADLSAAADVFGKKIKLDDLTLVEGVGPKIASLLNEAGVTTWRKLASTELSFIADILEKNSLGFHTPTTWPKQAEMAADGKWAELLKWQDELDGGK